MRWPQTLHLKCIYYNETTATPGDHHQRIILRVLLAAAAAALPAPSACETIHLHLNLNRDK